MTIRSIWTSAKAAALVAALAVGSLLVTDFAEARVGGGGSFGSRGGRTFSAPPATSTAPRAARPIERSITQPGRSANQVTTGSRFGGLRNILFGGLIGAALAGLFGFGGGFAAFLGFILQMALIAFLAMLAINWFRGRSMGGPALAGAGAGSGRGGYEANVYRTSAGGSSGQGDIKLAGTDFDAFERLLKDIQLAYANADLDRLGKRVTPEMLSVLARELDDNKRQGLSNDLSEPKLLKGDLSEAWREAGGEYATVAMQYEIIDAMVEIKTGRVVGGSTTEPQQVTELWTFWRPVGGTAAQWELSAIQQA
ncbi:MAG: TIM44-like domain-containing protein [Proteobacteria bacterium]|nr:TIM44-like domain-containing protein [Pseudomonadota bacterium]